MMVTTASYFGMGFGNFNTFYNTIDQRQDDISTVFPILRYGGMHGGDQTLQERNDKYNARYGIDINVFATFVGDLFLCLDRRVLMLAALLYGGILWVMLRSRRTVTFGGLIFIVVITQLPLHGVFYDKLMYVVSDIYLIIAVILSVLLALKARQAGTWRTGEETGPAGAAEPSV
jgi:phosphoglycerol transferase MdoB-like AlkP superfamily enzyme